MKRICDFLQNMFWTAIIFMFLPGQILSSTESRKLFALTVATKETDGYKRFQRSCQNNDLDLITQGVGQMWQGHDWKFNLFINEMEKLKADSNNIVLFTNSNATVLSASKESILEQFDKFKTQVVFSSNSACLADLSISRGCLNSSAFIGQAKDVYNIFKSVGDIIKKYDDGSFFINQFTEKKINIKLDEKAELFQHLEGAANFVKLRSVDSSGFIQNTKFDTRPKIILGNGNDDVLLNHFSNYIGGSWNQQDGCINCGYDTIDFDELLETPKLVLAIFIENETPFMSEFWKNIVNIEYEKSNIDVYIHNNVEYHEKEVEAFKIQWGQEKAGTTYNSIEVNNHKSGIVEKQARNYAIKKCNDLNCDFLFIIDSDAHLDNPYTLQSMIEQNRNVVGPLLSTPYFEMHSNFWNLPDSSGSFEKSIIQEQMEIVKNNRRGVWNVPVITSCYLIKGDLIRDHNLSSIYSDTQEFVTPAVAFSKNLRSIGVFIFISNRIDFGHLIYTENFDTSHKNNELWEMKNNKWDWEQRYIHPDYAAQLEKNSLTADEPCPDVYNFPMFTDTFCDELVDEVENFGLWTTDPIDEISGLPSRDAHMHEIGYLEQWLNILELYVQPLQKRIYIGYNKSPPESIKSFVIRYRPTDIPFLKPHHDASTYSITVGLNQPDIDYEGGGIHFLRRECKITSTEKGFLLMFPGHLTHYHEGLPTTGGTRYVLVSFIDPVN